ncbi:glutamate racemase [Maribacter aestuarii]|uniref:glutamate racemase n=1 Tax=Maribacter aestuarii TaxID=1130723 RepID=UPI00248B4A81|nr:glutamate racemase [Maribacter aestuarii]
MSKLPIGVFDSGIGGTSIWKEIQALLPKENSIYLADSKNAPYGEKSSEEILGLSIKNTEYLLNHNCKLIVVACNTATTNAIDYLRKTYKVPFIGIEPAIKPAALNSRSKSVGVLATKGTLTSSLFHSTSLNHGEGIEIVEQQGKGLVELIESGEVGNEKTRQLLQEYLRPMLDKGIDYLVLGCTHYPYLIPLLKELLPESVKIIDSGEAVARQTKSILEQHGILNLSKVNGKHQFYTNSNVSVLKRFLDDHRNSVKVAYLDF